MNGKSKTSKTSNSRLDSIQNKNMNINENMTKNMKSLEYDNHNDIMQKLIDLVEKHTEKIVFLENQLKDGANRN